MARWDAEIAADVGEDGTNLLTPDFCRDPVRGGQLRKQRGCVGGLGLGLGLAPRRTRLGGAREGAWRPGGWRGPGLGFGVKAGGGGGYFLPQQAGAEQALGDAGEDDGDVTGAVEAHKVARVVGRGAIAEGSGELRAVVDEFADEREEAAGAAWWG